MTIKTKPFWQIETTKNNLLAIETKNVLCFGTNLSLNEI